MLDHQETIETNLIKKQYFCRLKSGTAIMYGKR